jgi:hypothetical protein
MPFFSWVWSATRGCEVDGQLAGDAGSTQDQDGDKVRVGHPAPRYMASADHLLSVT